ncbi:MAG: phage major capsid protein [Cetobacterium sp.]
MNTLSIKDEIKNAVNEVFSLENLREKSISQIQNIGVSTTMNINENELREKALQGSKDFREYLNTGIMREKALVEMDGGTGATGEYTIPQNIYNRIIEKVKELSIMRNLANVQKITIGNSMDFILEAGEFGSSWIPKGGNRENTNTGTFQNVNIDLKDIFASPVISRNLLADSAFDLETYLVNKVAEKFAKDEELAFFNGVGTDDPTGLLTGVTADYVTIDYSNLNACIYDLENGYAEKACFIMNRKTMKAIKDIKDSNGRPLFIETSEITNKFVGHLLGYPVYFTHGIKEGEVVFGDMYESYGIVDKENSLTVDRDVLTIRGKLQLPTYGRVGGKPLKREAFKYIKVVQAKTK